MTAPEIGVGDTVHMTGTVTAAADTYAIIRTRTDERCCLHYADLTLVEKAKPRTYSNSATEPQRGDIALDPDGLCLYWWRFWTRQDDGERAATPTAPLQLLVRDGREFRGDQ